MTIAANDLILFARIVESGSLSRAAEHLGLPKSTVSRRLNELEHQIGERLLQRTTRQLILTDLGLSLLEHARQLAQEVEAASNVIQHRQALPSGRLRVSMPNDFASRFLVNALYAFRQQYPAINLELDLSPRRVDVLSEQYDLAVRMGNLPDDAYLVARRLAQFSVGLYASPRYISLHGLPEQPQDLMQHSSLNLLSQQTDAVRWSLRKQHQHWEASLPSPVLANSPAFLLQLACEGLGIAAVADSFASPYLKEASLVRILPDWSLPAVSAWAVFPERRLLPAKTRVFLNLLDQVLKDAE